MDLFVPILTISVIVVLGSALRVPFIFAGKPFSACLMYFFLAFLSSLVCLFLTLSLGLLIANCLENCKRTDDIGGFIASFLNFGFAYLMLIKARSYAKK